MAGALWVPDRRDIIWINCNAQVGREMKDLHPMLVLSPKPFNERTGIVIGLPMTTAKFNDTNPLPSSFRGRKMSRATCLDTSPSRLAGGREARRRIRGSVYRMTCSPLRASS
jgi:mRNA interferase MazF